MGQLVDGRWSDDWYDLKASKGRFVRWESAFRNWVGRDATYPAQAGRYHLYVSAACPWAHRVLIVRAMMGLEDVISVSVVAPIWDEGWSFAAQDGGTGDHLYGFDHLHQLYTLAAPDYSGRVTVPVLWDKQTKTIVNNESSEIIRMLAEGFAPFAAHVPDLYPAALQDEIDAVNEWVYRDLNNGVYRAGFAGTQDAYDEAVTAVFAALDKLEGLLADRDYLVGRHLTEADIRLFTTLIRFDPVYVGHFKCNIRRLADYPNLSAYLRRIYTSDGVADTVDIEQIKAHYYGSHPQLNPSGIIPKGPDIADLIG